MFQKTLYSKNALILALSLVLLPAAAMALPPVNSAEIFHGQISVTQSSAFDLVVRVERSATWTGQPETKEAFVLRSETPLPVDLAQLDGPARLVVRPDAVLIFAENQPALVLRTGPADLTHSQIGWDAMELNGYQLSRFQTGSEDYLHTALRHQLETPTPATRRLSGSELQSVAGGLLAIEADCDSGGAGAETCTISGAGGSCNATCNDGYDACCNESGCGCQAAQ